MTEKIKVVVKEPNKSYEIKFIDNDYSTMQKIVGGLIDVTYLPNRSDIDIVCNDEFLYNGMEANIMMPEIEHVFCGPLIFVGYNAEDGSSKSLTDEQIMTVIDYIAKNEVENMSVGEAFWYMKTKKTLKSMGIEQV